MAKIMGIVFFIISFLLEYIKEVRHHKPPYFESNYSYGFGILRAIYRFFLGDLTNISNITF